MVIHRPKKAIDAAYGSAMPAVGVDWQQHDPDRDLT